MLKVSDLRCKARRRAAAVTAAKMRKRRKKGKHKLSSMRVRGTFQSRAPMPADFPLDFPQAGTGDWKVASTRRHECRRHDPPPPVKAERSAIGEGESPIVWRWSRIRPQFKHIPVKGEMSPRQFPSF
jgi:hypothetical protein